LLLCGADQAEHVMVGGKWIVKERQLATIDIEKLQAEHRLAAKKLLAA
jgi:8-oxoguanine deaminase